MVVLASAMKIIGSLSVGELAKGLIGMAGALVILAVGLIAMSGTLGGSVALLAAATALAILAPTLVILGNLEWSTILKGLAAIALTLGVLSVVGLVASAGLVQLGVSLLPLAGVLVITAAAVYLFAKAMELLGAEGSKGVAVMIAAIAAFVAAIPTLVIEFVKGLLSIVEEITKLAPKILEAIGKMLDFIIQFVSENAPKLAIAIGILVNSILQVLVENIPKIQAAGTKLLLGLLTGISQNIGQVVTKVAEIITKFLTALTAQMPKIQAAGFKLLLTFLLGIGAHIPQVVATVGRIIVAFINAVAAQLPKIVATAGRMIVRFINAIGNELPKIITAGTNLVLKLMEGIGNAIPRLVKEGLKLARKFLNGVADGLAGLADAGFNAVIKFLNGLERSIRENMPELIQAGIGIADALLDGVKEGFGIKGWGLKKALDAVFGLLPGWAKKILGIHSPSRVFADIGGQTLLGFAKGVDDNHKPVQAAGENMAYGLIGAVKSTLGVSSPSKVMKDIGKEVGTGFKQGLDGSATDIRSSFKALRDKITQEMQTIRGEIKSGKDELKQQVSERKDLVAELTAESKKKKPDTGRIKELRAEIRELDGDIADSRRTLAGLENQWGKLKGVRKFVREDLANERKLLEDLSKQYEDVSEKLVDAEKVLEAATQRRDEALKSYTEQFAKLPDISSLLSDALAEASLTDEERREKARKKKEEDDKRSRINQVENYKQALREQLEATKKYNETLQKLRALGLDDATYKKLLDMGTAGQEFATQLLSGGKAGIDEINKLDSEVLEASTVLAKNAANNLYQAGVDAAQGLVDGLKAQEAYLKQYMENIANWMVDAIKWKLGIRSPSKVFAEIGKLMTQGLTKGLTESSAEVSSAAGQLGVDAVSAMKNTISDISSGYIWQDRYATHYHSGVGLVSS